MPMPMDTDTSASRMETNSDMATYMDSDASSNITVNPLVGQSKPKSKPFSIPMSKPKPKTKPKPKPKPKSSPLPQPIEDNPATLSEQSDLFIGHTSDMATLERELTTASAQNSDASSDGDYQQDDEVDALPAARSGFVPSSAFPTQIKHRKDLFAPRKIIKFYTIDEVKAKPHQNFYHHGQGNWAQGLPSPGRSAATAVRGPGAAAWKRKVLKAIKKAKGKSKIKIKVEEDEDGFLIDQDADEEREEDVEKDREGEREEEEENDGGEALEHPSEQQYAQLARRENEEEQLKVSNRIIVGGTLAIHRANAAERERLRKTVLHQESTLTSIRKKLEEEVKARRKAEDELAEMRRKFGIA